MKDPTAPDRRYGDHEMALILKVAAELETRDPAGEGRSLAEFQEIAAEAGIDPQLVVEAARALAAERSQRSSLTLGAPTSYQLRRTVAGQLPEDELGELVRVIRDVMGREGKVTDVLDSVEWRGTDWAGGVTHVQITPKQGQTRISISGRYGNPAGFTYLWSGVIAMIASVIVGTELQAAFLVEAAAIAGVWGAAYVGGRFAWQRMARGIQKRLSALAEGITAQVAASRGPEIRALAESTQEEDG